MFLPLLPFLLWAAGIFLSGTKAEHARVQLGNATVIGNHYPVTGVDAFLGIKYADSSRFEHAVMVDRYATLVNATVHAPACTQIKSSWRYDTYGVVEDCLYLEIYRPHSVTLDRTIPVLVWIHGGVGYYGSASRYLGYSFVNQSLAVDMPVIMVAINYRLAVWGMLGGKEASLHGAVNLGLYDQKLALQWVQEYIASFGGDKTRVTLWGQSSGSMDAHFHFLDETSELFRAAIMESGNIYSVPALDTSFYQGNYDALAKATACDTKADIFKCLQTVDLATLQSAMDKLISNPSSYSTRPWGLVIDGNIIPDTPSKLLAQGKFAKKPFIHGNVLDEGTTYPKPLPMETVNDMWTYFESDYLNKNSSWISNKQTKAKLLELYPADPAAGSPFNTGLERFGNGFTYKRAAALYGDIRYQAPRRSWSMDAMRNDISVWAYQLSEFTPSRCEPAYGVCHSTDLAYIFLEIPDNSDSKYFDLAKKMVNHWVAFAYNMDPNLVDTITWPLYGSNRNLMNFAIYNTSIIPDTFREEAILYLIDVQGQFGNPVPHSELDTTGPVGQVVFDEP